MQSYENQQAYIDHVKSLKCTICFAPDPDPDHLEALGMGSNRKKANMRHWSVVPLCRAHHRERHDTSIVAINAKYKVDLFKDAFKILRDYLSDKKIS